MTALLQPFRLFLQYRDILWDATMTQIRQRNAGTAFGSWWLVLSPIIFLAIYSAVYLFIFKIRSTGMSQIEYVLHIFAGLVPFIAMSESLASGTSSLEASQNLLKNTVFPIELVPMKFVLATVPGFLVGLGIILLATLATGHFHPTLLLVPVIFFLQLMFIVGMVWVLSLVNLIFRDIKFIVSYVVTIAMVTSPIAYTIEMIPEKLRFLIWLNPFAYFIISYQQIIVAGALPPTDIALLAAITGGVTFYAGFFLFRRLKPVVINYAA